MPNSSWFHQSFIFFNVILLSCLNTSRANVETTITIQSENYFCDTRFARKILWNVTPVNEVNIQPCPPSSEGLAKWHCVFDKVSSTPMWASHWPDLTECRSTWLISLGARLNNSHSSLISIANDLSQVTSVVGIYGGDLLFTTKIMQTMMAKMTSIMATFPDKRQRQIVLNDLLSSFVKTSSHLLDRKQYLSWLDLSFDDQMRAATTLLTELENTAFLLANTYLVGEQNIVKQFKNILLKIRVLDTSNIVENVIFPDLNLGDMSSGDVFIELQRNALVKYKADDIIRLVFMVFDQLETILQPPIATNRLINSKVIGASLDQTRRTQLSQQIRLVFKHLTTENVRNPSCVYWNYEDHGWNEDGCIVGQTNKTHTICSCNHLTIYALLMDRVEE